MFSAVLVVIQPEANLDPLTPAYAVIYLESGRKLNYRQLLKEPKYAKGCNISSGKEFDHLAQGKTGQIKSTDNIFFVHPIEVPADRKKDATYVIFQCSVHP